LRVWGPISSLTYGAEAWVRSVHNFNDGNDYLINFMWEAIVGKPTHHDLYYIQITDGYVPYYGDVHWPSTSRQNPEGTVNFLVHTDNGWSLTTGGISKTTWSMTITSDGIGKLYDRPNGSGSLIHQDSLDDSKPWYLRLMLIDATSAGFPGGDNRLNLYDFSSVSITPPPIPVEIDIKPGSWPNTINLGSNGVIPVAILTTETFDATSVNPSTVQLEGLGVAVRGKSEKLLSNEEDVDEDGDIDLVVKIETENLEPGAWQSGPVVLTGETYDGQAIEGCDEIIIVPPEE